MSDDFDPKCALDWILPFRREDNTAWEKANTLGRILFPFYILFTAFRTLVVNTMMLSFILLYPVLLLAEYEGFSKLGKYIWNTLKRFVLKSVTTEIQP